MLGIVASLLLVSSVLAAPDVKIDRQRSHFVAVTERAGLLGFLGHRHAIVATEWSVRIAYDPVDVSRSSVYIRVPVRDLEIDSARALKLAGLSSRPGEKTVRELQAKILGPRVLDAARNPEIAFHSTSIEARGPSELVVRGPLTLHGRSSEVAIPVTVTRLEAGEIRVSGEFEVRQSEYGITPESLAGIVRVADEVRIRFEVVGSIEAAGLTDGGAGAEAVPWSRDATGSGDGPLYVGGVRGYDHAERSSESRSASGPDIGGEPA
jgi:polyisoprenoid-binding protein YceI